MNVNLDEMIKDYSDELMSFARRYNIESPAVNKNIPDITDDEKETISLEDEPQQETVTVTREVSTEEADEIPSEDETESFAYFRARVFTGGEAYPIEKAGVTLYKNDILYAFLVTDKNGETAKIKIAASPEENSLEPMSDDQSIEYRADVFAEGFIGKENLLVSAVGSSEIVLETELTPESEGIT